MPQTQPPPEVAHHRARRAVAVRRGNHQVAAEAARDLAAAKAAAQLDKHVRAVVDSAPELTTAQRDRLAALLRRPGG